MTITTIPVRKARPSDRATVLSICEQNWQENGQFGLSMRKVEVMVDKAFNNEGCIIGAVGQGKNIEGIIMLLIAQFWYTDDWCLEEIMNYVLPEHRRSTHAKDMISFAKRCSDEIQIPLVIGVVSNERTKAKIELYRRQLGDPCGGYFLYPRNAIQTPA